MSDTTNTTIEITVGSDNSRVDRGIDNSANTTDVSDINYAYTKETQTYRLYRDVLPIEIVKKIKREIEKKNPNVDRSISLGLAQLTGDSYTSVTSANSVTSIANTSANTNNSEVIDSIAILFLSNCSFVLSRENIKKSFTINAGSILIFNNYWKYSVPKDSIVMFCKNKLPIIFSTIANRLKYAKRIKEYFTKIKESAQLTNKCVREFLNMGELLGKGSYGNVYKYNPSCLSCSLCAIKFAKLKPDSNQTLKTSSWHEVYILTEIIKPIIEKGISQHLPLIYDYFTCKECNLITDGEKVKGPCVISIMELASGTLKNHIQDKAYKNNTNEDFYYSILFQIMAGLYAIQMFGQILNFDIKKENILVYDIDSSVPYFSYNINGYIYKVPNYGKLFVINDFGISRPMSPNFPLYKEPKEITYRIGSRYAVIKDGVFVPFNTNKHVDCEDDVVNSPTIKWVETGGEGKVLKKSKGGEFRMYRENDKVIPLKSIIPRDIKKYLKDNDIEVNVQSKDFFLRPDIIPPFEFYNDTQDVIRIFTGGKRTTQRGNHKVCPEIPKDLINKLIPYKGVSENMKEGVFSFDPSQVLAGYFINDFFPKYTKYRMK